MLKDGELDFVQVNIINMCVCKCLIINLTFRPCSLLFSLPTVLKVGGGRDRNKNRDRQTKRNRETENMMEHLTKTQMSRERASREAW